MRLAGAKSFHGFLSRKGRPEQMIVGTRFDLHRLLGVSLVQPLRPRRSALGDMLDFHRPTRRHVAGLDPVVDDRAVEPEGARDIGLASEDLYEAGGAVHDWDFGRLACQNEIDKPRPTSARTKEAQLIGPHPDPSGQTPEALVLLAEGLLVLLGVSCRPAPCRSRPCARHLGALTASFTARLSRATIARGVRAATTRRAAPPCRTRILVSATVTSGVSAERLAMLNASTRRRPVLIAPAAAG